MKKNDKQDTQSHIENSDTDKNMSITFFLDEEETTNSLEIDIHSFLDDFEEKEANTNSDLFVPHIMNYHENFTVKELLLICEYYGISRDLKANKCNKEQIIYFLVEFESNINNSEIVCKRKNLWFYLNEVKNDKFMKKYVLW
jgi:hypothetical protein